MSFRSVFLAVVIAFALVMAAFLINRARPGVETEQPSAELVRASGKCAECHARTQYSVVHEYEMSMHAAEGRELSGVPPAGGGSGEEGPSRLRDLHQADRRQLPQLPRRHLSAISPQPARGARRGPRSTARKG